MITVFTNGVFDIVHSGHIRLLKYARSLGDKLIVGINSDWSTQRLKGPTRPIFNEQQRRQLLEELKCVDEVVIFQSDTPDTLIKSIAPGVLIKGPEAANANIPGAEYVKSYGGKVIIPDWEVAVSTTSIIERVLVKNDHPLPIACEIKIDSKGDVMLENCSLMFNKLPDGYRPVLCYNGRRVIKSWDCQISHVQPSDKNGCSA